MTQLGSLESTIETMVNDLLVGTSFFIVELGVHGTSGSPVVNVYLDGDEGITIKDCAQISRGLRAGIEEKELAPQGLELNVSSPGLKRSLLLPRQYPRHVGRNVKLKVLEAEAYKTVEGRLLGTVNEMVRIESETGEIELPLESIRQAVVKAAW